MVFFLTQIHTHTTYNGIFLTQIHQPQMRIIKDELHVHFLMGSFIPDISFPNILQLKQRSFK